MCKKTKNLLLFGRLKLANNYGKNGSFMRNFPKESLNITKEKLNKFKQL